MLGDNEVFIDGGAYIGDSAEQFIEKYENKGKYHIHSFEPDKDNFVKASSKLSTNLNVTIVQKGLWSSETELIFLQNARNTAGSSLIYSSDATHEYFVPVTSLDSYFKNKYESEWPTFIKMDIEGAEREALLGSSEIIKRRKPKLAICAYHKPEDIYELPQTILSIRDDYRFALRQHEYGCWDTILYAV